jgi:serine/threonine-protein kinase
MLKNYSITKEIGRGGMTTIFFAENQMLNYTVVEEQLNNDFSSNEYFHKIFLIEARKIGRMNHSKNLKIMDFFEQDNNLAYVMEYIEGKTLKELIEQKWKS